MCSINNLNMLVLDIVGKIIKGGRVTYVRYDKVFQIGCCEIFLQDWT